MSFLLLSFLLGILFRNLDVFDVDALLILKCWVIFGIYLN
jgi:hypothetical protein